MLVPHTPANKNLAEDKTSRSIEQKNWKRGMNDHSPSMTKEVRKGQTIILLKSLLQEIVEDLPRKSEGVKRNRTQYRNSRFY